MIKLTAHDLKNRMNASSWDMTNSLQQKNGTHHPTGYGIARSLWRSPSQSYRGPTAGRKHFLNRETIFSTSTSPKFFW